MPQPQFGLWRWTIHRWNEHPNPFAGRPDLALLWLRQFESDGLFVQELRRLMGSQALLPAEDARLLQDAADQLSAGTLQICGEFCGHYRTAGTETKFTEADDDAIPPKSTAPAPAPATSNEETPQEAAAAAFAPNTDDQTTAQVLKEAAQNGTPFCEECAKPKPQPAPVKAPEPEATLPADVDAAAVAQALRDAAETGVPFCAECLKPWQTQPAGTGN